MLGDVQYGSRIRENSILKQPFVFISLAVMTLSASLEAQMAGDSVRVFSGDTIVVGQIAVVSDEGFEFASGRFFAYRDLDRLEMSNWNRLWGHRQHELAVLFGVVSAIAGYVEPLAGRDAISSAFEVSLMGSALGAVVGTIYSPSDEKSWKPVSVRDYFVPLLGDRFAYGGRVRVSVDGSEIIGRATAMTDDGFELVQGGMRRTFAYRDIDGLEWSRGMRSRWKTAWGLGLLGGFIAFPTLNGAWGCVTSDWQGPSCEDKGRDMFAWIGAGGLLGLGAGMMWRPESWESLALDDNRVGISPFVTPQRGLKGRHGLLLGVRFDF